MTSTEQFIMDYARQSFFFSVSSLRETAENSHISYNAVRWALLQLMEAKKLARIGRGKYAISDKSVFTAEPDEEIKALYNRFHSEYPTVKFCIYKGSVLSVIQHHLSYNAITYIETDRDLTEIIFHQMQGERPNVYWKPSIEMFNNYINISIPGIIIKPLVTDSPLQEVEGVPSPTLEKLLVDIRKDDDFHYLSGQESQYMLENAFSLYAINTSKLLRYAGRRGIREEMETAIDTLNQ